MADEKHLEAKESELQEAQLDASILSVEAIKKLLNEPDPGDPYDFDYRKRLFGEEEGAGYDGELPAQIPRAAVTAFLMAYARLNTYSGAAAHTAYSVSRWHQIRKRDAEVEREVDGEIVKGGDFTHMLDVAREVHAESLYEAGHSFGFHGTHEVVYHGGKVVGMKRTKNARLVELYLKRKHPDFKEERLSDVTKAGGVLVVTEPLDREAFEKRYGSPEED